MGKNGQLRKKNDSFEQIVRFHQNCSISRKMTGFDKNIWFKKMFSFEKTSVSKKISGFEKNGQFKKMSAFENRYKERENVKFAH